MYEIYPHTEKLIKRSSFAMWPELLNHPLWFSRQYQEAKTENENYSKQRIQRKYEKNI